MDNNPIVQIEDYEYPCEFVEMDSISPLVSKTVIKVCYVDDSPNRKGTVINKDRGIQMAKTLPGCPIVGHYIKDKSDFGGHDKKYVISGNEFEAIPTTTPYGFVDLNPKVWFKKELDDNGIEREYLYTEGYIWTGQFEEANRILEKGNNQSMELDIDLSDGEWNNDMSFFVLNKAVLSKLCILGEDVEPCFEGASISQMNYSNSNFVDKFYHLMRNIQYTLEEGGNGLESVTPNIQQAAEPQNTPVVTEPIKDTPPSVVEPSVVEPQSVEQQPQQLVINTPDVNQNLINENAELKNKIVTLEQEIADLKQVNYSLNEYKKETERVKKQEMIDSFSNLTESEKLDVVSHIDEYSLDVIESKLSVLDIRKQRSTAAYGNTNVELQQQIQIPHNDVYSYSINTQGGSDAGTPDWVKAAIQITKEIE